MVTRKKYTIVYLMVFLLGVLSASSLQAAPAYEMQRYCKDKAVQTYRLQREAIHTAVPRFLDGYYSVYAKSPKKTEDALFFVCQFTRNGRFIQIKTEKDLRPGRAVPPTKAAKRSCKGEASSVWCVPRKVVKISDIRRVNAGRYIMDVEAGGRKARCDVNAQGHIYSFKKQTAKREKAPKPAKRACKQLASRLWKVPVSAIKLDRFRNVRHDRYHIRVQYGRTLGNCDVNGNGHIYHFKTRGVR